jgi:hypothetical protein
MFQIMNVEPERATAVDASLPGSIDAVLARSLAKDPNERTPDVLTFAKELAAALTSHGMSPPSPPQRAFVPAEDPREALDAGDFEAFRELAPQPRERSIAGPVVAVLVLLAAVAALAFYLRGGSRPATSISEVEPIAMATAIPPAEAPEPRPTVVPTSVPTARPPTPAPTARPVERSTEPPRAERPTERPKPTAPPVAAKPTIAVAARVAPTAPPAVVAPPPPPPAAKPSIDVISEPAGAEVLVDGSFKGRTPLRISDLDPGSYQFEVRKQGRNSYRQTTELEANADYTMKVSLPIVVNSLRVLSQPDGVDVKINGEAKGRTPLTLSQLPDGHYDVTGELAGFEPQTFGVELKDGQLQEVRFRFATKRAEGE